MNTLELDVISREQASHNNVDVEKSQAHRPDAG
jgi:hypothetical protein